MAKLFQPKIKTDPHMNKDVMVIDIKGHLGHESQRGQLREDYEKLARGGEYKHLIIKFEKDTNIDTIGGSILIDILNLVEDNGGRLCFVGVTPAYREEFERMSLTDYIDIFVSEDEALENLKKGDLG